MQWNHFHLEKLCLPTKKLFFVLIVFFCYLWIKKKKKHIWDVIFFSQTLLPQQTTFCIIFMKKKDYFYYNVLDVFYYERPTEIHSSDHNIHEVSTSADLISARCTCTLLLSTIYVLRTTKDHINPICRIDLHGGNGSPHWPLLRR